MGVNKTREHLLGITKTLSTRFLTYSIEFQIIDQFYHKTTHRSTFDVCLISLCLCLLLAFATSRSQIYVSFFLSSCAQVPGLLEKLSVHLLHICSDVKRSIMTITGNGVGYVMFLIRRDKEFITTCR